jgi:hypothetical protein
MRVELTVGRSWFMDSGGDRYAEVVSRGDLSPGGNVGIILGIWIKFVAVFFDLAFKCLCQEIVVMLLKSVV